MENEQNSLNEFYSFYKFVLTPENPCVRNNLGVSWGGHESLVFPALSFDENRTKEGFANNLKIS